MRLRLLAACVSFTSLLVLAPGALAQVSVTTLPTKAAATYAISGKVLFGEADRITELTVQLRRASGGTIASSRPKPGGEFTFLGVPSGDYLLVVQDKGIELVREMVSVTIGSQTDIVLRSFGLSNQPSAGSGPVSARELSLPKKTQEAFDKGREAMFDRKDSKASIPHFERAVKESPEFYEGHYLLGVAYAQSGRPVEAEAAYRKAIELSQENYAPAQASLAGLWCDQQKFAAAEPAARRAVALDPADWQGHFHLARALFGLGRVDEAEQSLKEAMSRKSAYADFYLLSANIHIRRKDYPAVIKDLDEYLKLEPSGPRSEQMKQLRSNVIRRIAESQAQSPPR